MEFFKELTSLKKSLPEHYFINIFKDLSNKILIALCGLLAIEIEKPKRILYTGDPWSHNMKETKSSNRL
jgi:hypothetical protein